MDMDDDPFASQPDGVGEVGWDAGPKYCDADSKPADLSKLCKKFSVSKVKKAKPSKPSSSLIIESPEADRSMARTRTPKRPNTRSRPVNVKSAVEDQNRKAKEMMAKLAAHYERKEREAARQQQNQCTEAKRPRIGNDDVDDVTKARAQWHLTSTQAVPAALPELGMSPIALPSTRNNLSSPLSRRTASSDATSRSSTPLTTRARSRLSKPDTPKTPNVSSEELWSDNDVFENDSFLRQTQTVVNQANKLTSPPAVCKRAIDDLTSPVTRSRSKLTERNNNMAAGKVLFREPARMMTSCTTAGSLPASQRPQSPSVRCEQQRNSPAMSRCVASVTSTSTRQIIKPIVRTFRSPQEQQSPGSGSVKIRQQKSLMSPLRSKTKARTPIAKQTADTCTTGDGDTRNISKQLLNAVQSDVPDSRLPAETIKSEITSPAAADKDLLNFGEDDSLTADPLATQQLLAMMDEVESTEASKACKPQQSRTETATSIRQLSKPPQKAVTKLESVSPKTAFVPQQQSVPPKTAANIKPKKYIIVPSQASKKILQERHDVTANRFNTGCNVNPSATTQLPRPVLGKSNAHPNMPLLVRASPQLNMAKNNVQSSLSTRQPYKSFQKYRSFDDLHTSASAKEEVTTQLVSSQDSPSRTSARRYTQQQIEQKKLLAMQKRNKRLKLQNS